MGVYDRDSFEFPYLLHKQDDNQEPGHLSAYRVEETKDMHAVQPS